MALTNEIKECIEKQLDKGKRNFIIFPFGEVGMKVRTILKEVYGIEADYILDNHLWKYNSDIKALDFLKGIDCKEYVLILAAIGEAIYGKLKEDVLQYISEENVAELNSMKSKLENRSSGKSGKYSYGPLCNHWLVEKVGAFCSFAIGCDAVENHPVEYVSTHPFLYWGGENDSMHDVPHPYNMKDVIPKGCVKANKKSLIGNDVWLGKNVLITNGANIGNGVIAAAGAVITKDVPDYAVVGGVPAKIIRYRYTPEQIEALNRIQWWNWSDDEIRKRYDDFYLPIEEFVAKYDV